MYEITWQIAELIFELLFIVWMAYHALEYLWFMITKKSSTEMNDFLSINLMKLYRKINDVFKNKSP